MAKTGITVRFRVEGLQETLKAFRELPKNASDELRDAAQQLSEFIALKVRQSGMSDAAPQSRLVATTVKAKRDRVPVVEAGGTTPLGRRGKPAYKLLFGSIFGSDVYTQFGRPHAGTAGYWFFPVIEENQAEISKAWTDAADAVVRKFSEEV